MSQIIVRPGHGLEIRVVLGQVVVVVVVLDLIVSLASDVIVDVLGSHNFGWYLHPCLHQRRPVYQVLGEHAYRQVPLQILLLAQRNLCPAVFDRLQCWWVQVIATDQPRTT